MRDFLPVQARRGFHGSLFFGYVAHIEWNGAVLQEKPCFKRAVGQAEAKRLGGCNDMTSWMMRATGAALITVVGLVAGSSAIAQESTNNVATMTDWSVFTDENPKECWGVSSPRETVNTRDGQPASVRRGDILLFVTYRAGGAAGEISFSGGYPFAGGSTVKIEIDGTAFDLFTNGEWGWPGTKEDDAAILAALKKGSTAVLTGRSGKGTQTQDTFSLRGFTAAMEEAAKRCQ